MKKPSKSCKQPIKGFSLLELTLFIFILGLFCSFGYEALRDGSKRVLVLEQLENQAQEIDTAISIISRDLRCAYISIDRPESLFVGHLDSESLPRLDFCRTANRNFDEDALQGIEIYVEKNPKSGELELWRKIDGQKLTLLCQGLLGYQVRFFDGEKWLDDWGWNGAENQPYLGIRGLPQLVSIEITAARTKGQEMSRTVLIPVMVSLLNGNAHA